MSALVSYYFVLFPPDKLFTDILVLNLSVNCFLRSSIAMNCFEFIIRWGFYSGIRSFFFYQSTLISLVRIFVSSNIYN